MAMTRNEAFAAWDRASHLRMDAADLLALLMMNQSSDVLAGLSQAARDALADYRDLYAKAHEARREFRRIDAEEQAAAVPHVRLATPDERPTDDPGECRRSLNGWHCTRPHGPDDDHGYVFEENGVVICVTWPDVYAGVCVCGRRPATPAEWRESLNDPTNPKFASICVKGGSIECARTVVARAQAEEQAAAGVS